MAGRYSIVEMLHYGKYERTQHCLLKKMTATENYGLLFNIYSVCLTFRHFAYLSRSESALYRSPEENCVCDICSDMNVNVI